MPSQLAATLSSDCAEFEIVSKSSPTCDKLWEKGNIGGKVKEVLLTSYFALINVDNVGKGLKAVE